MKKHTMLLLRRRNHTIVILIGVFRSILNGVKVTKVALNIGVQKDQETKLSDGRTTEGCINTENIVITYTVTILVGSYFLSIQKTNTF